VALDEQVADCALARRRGPRRTRLTRMRKSESASNMRMAVVTGTITVSSRSMPK
jgi:hypothetical protein